MFITSREKAIIDLIVKTSGKHTVHSLSAFLNVSGRTIQRNLKSIEGVLQKHHLELKRTPADGLFIGGKDEHIYRLIQEIAEANVTDETPEERKWSLLLILLHDGPSYKKSVLANQLGISITTLNSYLEDVTVWLERFDILLTSKRGVGLELIADEEKKRHALASFVLVHFYEDIIDSIYVLQTGNVITQEILGYFNSKHLLTAYDAVEKRLSEGQLNIVDSDYVGLVIHVCLAVQRIEAGYELQSLEETQNLQSNEYLVMNEVANDISEDLSIELSSADIYLWSIVLRGSKLQEPGSVQYESIFLGHVIKNVIRAVSANLNIDLTDDFSLFQGLLAHMGPSIYRLNQQQELFNPLTDEIKKKYPVLYLAVKDSLESEFTDMAFPEAEIAFIVLHFGSALLMNEEKVRIDAVVVCPSGIGASKMLASRIQKELPMIHPAGILSISDFHKANLSDYDIVISTVRLPFTNTDYILVSPLLSDADTVVIQDYVQNNMERITREEYMRPPQQARTGKSTGLATLLQEIKDVHKSIESILGHFRVFRKTAPGTHKDVLNEMVRQAKEDGLIENTEKVIQHLEDREHKGGLGIPNTNMGLFHCLDENVNNLLFQVAHLDQPCTIKGMDGNEMEMKSLLLMFGPEGLSERENEVLSLISTSLIENNTSMMIYSSTNEAMIYKKLEDIFLEYLNHNLIKE